MLNEVFANWTRLVLGVCTIMLTLGVVTGHVSPQILQIIVGLVAGTHAITSGIQGKLK